MTQDKIESTGGIEDLTMLNQDQKAENTPQKTSLSAVDNATKGEATPGPWEASQYGFSDEQKLEETHVIAEKDEVNDDFRIADCYGPDHKINAHLIAASPELLKACREFVFLEKTNMTKKQVRLRIEIARAAIAKATAINNNQTR